MILLDLPAARRRSALLCLGSFLFLSACEGDTSPHYKVTATVDVNGRTYTGSSVQAFPCDRFSSHFVNGVNSCMVKGEAVVVDLGKRGKLFLAFRGKEGDISSMVVSIFQAGGQNPFTGEIASLPPSWTLPVSDMPTMVTFADVRVPQSVKQVDPANLGAAFGSGVSLKSVRIQKTNEAITIGAIDRMLPFLQNNTGGTYLTGRSISAPSDGFPGELQYYSFKIGV